MCRFDSTSLKAVEVVSLRMFGGTKGGRLEETVVDTAVQASMLKVSESGGLRDDDQAGLFT